jgi:formate dehydrogenase subunit delta
VSSGKIDKLVRMANQIGEFFATQPEAIAAEGVAVHLKKFWTPKMIGEIVERAAQTDSGLNPTAARGISLLATEKA